MNDRLIYLVLTMILSTTVRLNDHEVYLQCPETTVQKRNIWKHLEALLTNGWLSPNFTKEFGSPTLSLVPTKSLFKKAIKELEVCVYL